MQFGILCDFGTGQATKTDKSSEKFQKGGGSLSIQKNYIADFGPLCRALKSAFRKNVLKIHSFWYSDLSLGFIG